MVMVDEQLDGIEQAQATALVEPQSIALQKARKLQKLKAVANKG